MMVVIMITEVSETTTLECVNVADFSDFMTTENTGNLKSLKLTILTTNDFNHVFPHLETRSIPIFFFPMLISPRGIFDQKMRKIEEDVF